MQILKQRGDTIGLVYTNSTTVIEFCDERGILTRPILIVNKFNMPVLKELLLSAQRGFPNRHIVYLNSDILLNPSVLSVASHIISNQKTDKVKTNSVSHLVCLRFSSY